MATIKLLGKVRGDDGAPATIQFADAVTLAPGAQAKAVNIGSQTNAILQLHIPAGQRGADGADGARGRDGADGAMGPQGPRGRDATVSIRSVEMVEHTEEPSAENVGTASDSEWILKIPKQEGLSVDDAFVDGSENPVQSKVILAALEEKANALDIPSKTSDLTNDRSFVSAETVDIMIEDALLNAGEIAVPIDSALSTTSVNPVQNKVITEELARKPGMSLEDVLDDETNTKVGERVTLSNGSDEVSMILTGQDITAAVLTKTVAERTPVIVASLPDTGSEDLLYLVPASDDKYSMHLWMDVAGEMKYVSVNGGGGSTPDLSGYALKSDLDSYATKSELSGYATTSSLNSYAVKRDAIKNITRNGTTFTATRADNTTFTFTQQGGGSNITGRSIWGPLGSQESGTRNIDIEWAGHNPVGICGVYARNNSGILTNIVITGFFIDATTAYITFKNPEMETFCFVVDVFYITD